ncbi:putative lipoprotein [Cordyceps militaris CM01]|uniref:Putative lipoprotein n=1 Tax=Cordyceps militaris (strain CM01) TaxID=983644 RepID=G3J9L2_CORMM|nr:putative lipoprotein [Cordyceps militaris CM01]EGX94138.1 putative lipoprotein [Cordyceps militaris CM01]
MMLLIAAFLLLAATAVASTSSCAATTLHLPDPPYDNYFYSDCHVDAQAVITSPLPDSNLSIIGPRLIVAWPGGNSGVCAFFAPQNGNNGSLAIALVNSTLGSPLSSVVQNGSSKEPKTGVQGVLSFNNSASLSLSILGSVRTIRDFVEGPSLLTPLIQDAVKIQHVNGTAVQISRLWLDNVTTTTLTLSPWQNQDGRVHVTNKTVTLGAGFYRFSATYNYPQLKQLKPQDILRNESMSLVGIDPEQVDALSFFSYSDKLLAGGWRFLTYFGRDSMIATLLLQPILKSGPGSAMEAVLGAALERINKTDGTVAHEETIGDYATFTNMQNGIFNSTAAGFTYQMIDTDYYLPILMNRYFQGSPERVRPLLTTKAGAVNVANKNMTWGDLGHRLASKIMNLTAAFEQQQTAANLMHLQDGVPVGQWRDSERGLANGRIPFDVNCALVPAALRAIASLSAMSGVFPAEDAQKWRAAAGQRADVWQNKTLAFFKYSDSVGNSTALLENYVKENTFYNGPTHADSVANYSSGETLVDYGLALPSANDSGPLRITHTDTAFRNVLLFNTTDDENQLTEFINSTANAILRPFPAGLTTPIGAVVANPALSGDATIIANFTNAAYHGTVVWSWQLALVAQGFALQLGRCGNTTTSQPAAFCLDVSVYGALRAAYNRIWDVIEDNQSTLQSEVWSWTYSPNSTRRDGFTYAPLGVLPPPPGAGAGTESDVRQLWSLVFLAMSRDIQYRN